MISLNYIMSDKGISEFITFPKSFEKYRWYKPILVFIIALILSFILTLVLVAVFSGIYGQSLMESFLSRGYEVMNTEMGQIFSELGVIIMLPSLYIATKIVKDRPFSSYASSRGGWNHKLFFKALIIPFIVFLVIGFIQNAIVGSGGEYHFSILFFIITLILVPLQSIAEEYAYRGLIMQAFGSWFNIPLLAVILQAIIFALSHGYNSLGNIEVFVFGLLMGFLAWKSNGIEVSSAFHAGNNLAIALLVMFGMQASTSNVQMNDVIIAFIVDIVLTMVIYYVAKKSNWFGEIPENSQNA